MSTLQHLYDISLAVGSASSPSDVRYDGLWLQNVPKQMFELIDGIERWSSMKCSLRRLSDPEQLQRVRNGSEANGMD
jgi:hypothetical protein